MISVQILYLILILIDKASTEGSIVCNKRLPPPDYAPIPYTFCNINEGNKPNERQPFVVKHKKDRYDSILFEIIKNIKGRDGQVRGFEIQGKSSHWNKNSSQVK
jgi:hypothetical protein